MDSTSVTLRFETDEQALKFFEAVNDPNNIQADGVIYGIIETSGASMMTFSSHSSSEGKKGNFELKFQ